MRFHKNAKIEGCCRRGVVDEACYPKLFVAEDADGGVPYLQAGDGNVMVRIPVDPGGNDQTGLVPVEAITAARRHVPRDKANEDNLTLECAESAVDVPDADQRHGRPDITGSLFREHELAVPNPNEHFTSVVLDAPNLKRIADAFGGRRVKLTFHPEDNGDILVEPEGDTIVPGAVGVMVRKPLPLQQD